MWAIFPSFSKLYYNNCVVQYRADYYSNRYMHQCYIKQTDFFSSCQECYFGQTRHIINAH